MDAARESDEADRDKERRERDEDETRHLLEALNQPGGASQNGSRGDSDIEMPIAVSSILYSLLMELRTLSFEAEVSLLVMRYASDISSRGILFMVKDDELCGLGQFGFKSRLTDKSIDQEVRSLRIALSDQNILSQVARTAQPYFGEMPEDTWHMQMTNHFGIGSRDLAGFVLPLVCESRTMFLLYGDNYPEENKLTGINELVILANQSTLALEKLALERRLNALD